MRLRLLLIPLLIALALPAAAQEPNPARLTGTSIDGGDPVELTFAWRFQSGDDPAWSDPSFDDRSWEILDPQLPASSRPRGGWTGRGWFRRHLVVDAALRARPVMLSLEAPGNAEVFVDGVPLFRTGSAVPRPLNPGSTISGRGVMPQRAGAWGSATLSDRPEHVIAVRYVCDCPATGNLIGFKLSLERPGALESRAIELRRTAILLGAFTALPSVLALLHFGLFLFYPKARENLFCALCMLSFAVIVSGSFAGELGARGQFLFFFQRLNFAAVVSAITFGLLTYFAVRTERMPRSWKLFVGAAVLMTLANPWMSEQFGTVCWSLLFAASIAEIIRVEASGRTVSRESAFPLLVGMVLLDAAILLQILIVFGIIPAPFGFDDPYLLGILAFSIATSMFVARSFARTSLHLERRLEEVQALSAQVIATERESARKSIEIEAARTLQRSILPLEVPQLPGLEIAATVTTAAEVGGDYYDFRRAGDDSVVVAVGDAAGHGVAAGAMVVATKALFSSMAGEENLPRILTQCDQVLRGMNVRPLHMCLLLARLTTRSLTVCSAAMPRVLHLRADGTIREIEAGGLPLASGLSPVWEEVSEELSAGDVLLFASDGLAETLSAAGDPIGYDGVSAMFRAAAAPGRGAGEIAAMLMSEAERWRATREQNDDIAIVVVRITA